MFFSIEPNNGVAIYEQIIRQVKFAIAEGTLRPGQLLPSVRVLSQQLAINPNTIARAFQQLQADGAVETLRGRGLAVRSDSQDDCIAARRSMIAERLKSALSEALHAGLSEDEIRDIVSSQFQLLAGNVLTVSSNHSVPIEEPPKPNS